MGVLLKGALVEYTSDFLGAVPNIVLFQFNPEELRRSIQIPPRATRATSRENDQSGDPPLEVLALTAVFNSDVFSLLDNPALSYLAGVGPQIAALEKMVLPKGPLSGPAAAVVDRVAAEAGAGSSAPSRPVPRRALPRTLFIWGAWRVLPVTINSMLITEKGFDRLLNPVRAEVALELGIMEPDPCSDDEVAKGAWSYSSHVKDVQAAFNLTNLLPDVVDLFTF